MDRVYVMELVRSMQCGYITRRAFLERATVALGSLSAAGLLLTACAEAPAETPPPVVAGASATPGSEAAGATPTAGESAATPGPVESSNPDIVTETVTYSDVNGAPLLAYVARSLKGGSLPGVMVIQEWWGLDEHIQAVTRRLAEEGFIALAPDLYHGVVVTEPDEARKLVMELDMEAAVQEIRQGVAFLQEQSFVTGPKIGIVGFCMGGRLALQTARVEEGLGATVAFYGTPLSADEARDVKAPLLGLYGDADQGIPVSQVKTMEVALESAGITHEMVIYEGAPHAFLNDTRPSYHPEAASDAWAKMVAWFQTHLSETS